jgi:HAD superfamily hydrolase (TIGR01509 family)
VTLKALIFDFDGVIIDSETPDYLTWQELFGQFSSDLPLEVWEKGMGASSSAFDPLEYLENQVNLTLDKGTLRGQRLNIYRKIVDKQPILPGVRAAMSRANQMGLKVGVASSAGREWVHGHLTRLGLDRFVEVVCTGDEVEKAKPDPQLYRLALQRLELGPHEALAIEDSPNGIHAARQAGLFCIAVLNPVNRNLSLKAASLVVGSLADVEIDELARLFEENSL